MKFIQNCILWEHYNLWSRRHYSIPHTKHLHTLIYIYTCKTLLTAFKYEAIQEKISCAKNRFIEFIMMYIVVSYINYVYVHTLKINSKIFNMYVVYLYLKHVYNIIYLHMLKINSEKNLYIYMCINTILTHTLKPISSIRNSLF